MKQSTFSLARLLVLVSLAVVLALFYAIWTHSTDPGNLSIIFLTALLVAVFFSDARKMPALTPRKVFYSLAYILFLIKEIIKSNFDVARRVIQPVMPINPGIVPVKTKLKSPIGRMILANSITLTPGTLTVDVRDDHFYIHWIDVTDRDEHGATQAIVSGFEKYLEVIFG